MGSVSEGAEVKASFGSQHKSNLRLFNLEGGAGPWRTGLGPAAQVLRTVRGAVSRLGHKVVWHFTLNPRPHCFPGLGHLGPLLLSQLNCVPKMQMHISAYLSQIGKLQPLQIPFI